MFVFPTDRFGGRRVKMPSKMNEFTFFLAGNWYRPETGQHTVHVVRRPKEANMGTAQDEETPRNFFSPIFRRVTA